MKLNRLCALNSDKRLLICYAGGYKRESKLKALLAQKLDIQLKGLMDILFLSENFIR